MRTIYRFLVIMIALGFIAPPRISAQTVYEPFDYSAANPVLGQNGGIGWAGPWTFLNTWQTTSPGLTFGSLVTQGNMAQNTGGIGAENRRSFASPFLDTGGDVWFSFLTRPNDANVANSYNGLTLLAGVGSTGGRSLFVGWIGGVGTTYGMATFPAIGFVGTDVAPTQGVTAYLVGRIQFAAGNDTITLWANPTPGLANPDTTSFVKTDYDFGASVDGAYLYGGVNEWATDEIRFGSSFASVSAIPEPTTWALIATVTLSGSGMMWRKRYLRNRKRTYVRKV